MPTAVRISGSGIRLTRQTAMWCATDAMYRHFRERQAVDPSAVMNQSDLDAAGECFDRLAVSFFKSRHPKAKRVNLERARSELACEPDEWPGL